MRVAARALRVRELVLARHRAVAVRVRARLHHVMPVDILSAQAQKPAKNMPTTRPARGLPPPPSNPRPEASDDEH